VQLRGGKQIENFNENAGRNRCNMNGGEARRLKGEKLMRRGLPVAALEFANVGARSDRL
jgi:hypothetical protein